MFLRRWASSDLYHIGYILTFHLVQWWGWNFQLLDGLTWNYAQIFICPWKHIEICIIFPMYECIFIFITYLYCYTIIFQHCLSVIFFFQSKPLRICAFFSQGNIFTLCLFIVSLFLLCILLSFVILPLPWSYLIKGHLMESAMFLQVQNGQTKGGWWGEGQAVGYKMQLTRTLDANNLLILNL